MHRRDNSKATAIVFVLLAYFFAAPAVFGASASITEIMYDLPGSDTGREWIEIKNVDAAETVFSQWKFFEGNTNHGIILFRGSATSSSGGTAIIADEPEKFLIDWPDFSGTIFKSSFSLSNSGETIALKFDGAVVDEVSYASTTGAAGDGNGLQKSASGWQALPPTPGIADFPAAVAVIGGAADASQTPDEATSTVPDSSETAAPPQPPPPPPSGGGGGSEPLKPKLFVYAVAPARTVAGADALFSAFSVGVKKEPILNARYLWSFGDGAFAEGEKVLHAYHYPGAYVVLVEASSGEWSATDRKDITVFAPALSIVRIAEGADGFIEVSNGGADDVDVSRWFLQNSQEFFSFPKGTIIKARSAVPFPAAITKIHAVADNAPALLYPNGKVVARYAPPKVESSSSSASLPAEQAVLRSPALPPAPPAEKGSPSLVLVTAAASVLKENPVDETGEKDKDKDIVSSIATLPFASTSEILLAAAGSGVRGNSIGKWIAATLVLLSAAVLGYGFLLRAPARETTPAEKLKEEAEKYDLVE